MMKKYFASVLLSVVSIVTYAKNFNDASVAPDVEYCAAAGGIVEEMSAEYSTASGKVLGNTKRFCTFNIENGFVVVALSTFASDKPTIAATLIKKLPEIPSDSPLLKGQFNNPSLNFCKNIGGSSIAFFTSSGGYTDEKGQSDVCTFGDGSMVSGWSLIYIANHRSGYELVREKTRAEPLAIKIPGN